MTKNLGILDEVVMKKIYFIRGQKVILDKDLAELYNVTTGNLNKAIKRNLMRFPEDFMFQLTYKGVQKLDIPKWNIKLGRHEEDALCFYGTGGGHVIQRAE